MSHEETAATVARALITTGCIHVRPGAPFTLASGRASPVYLDCRRLISFPAERRTVCDLAARHIDAAIGRDAVDVVAGGETAGIPYAAWIADRLDRPMVYVRKQPKGYGRNARIEGCFAPDDRVLLVEDLATDGGSKLSFISGLRQAGAVVTDTLVVFHYGIFPQSVSTLADAGVVLHGLTTWADVVAVAEQDGSLPADGLAELRAFMADPDGWSDAHDPTR